MIRTSTVADEILGLKTQRKAVILAHHYQDPEIQEVADHVGDSLELARMGHAFAGEVIAFCGVKFMAETAKVLNPSKIVVLPDSYAGCSLVDSCPAAGVRAFRRRNPGHVVVSYIHTSVEVKAESDILCTSRNAVAVVNSIPAQKPILFLPDINLGNYVKKQTGRQNMQLWQGACIVHATFQARKLAVARVAYPKALVASPPECPSDVLRLSDFIGSSSDIVEWCRQHSADEFILMTESGVRYSLQRDSPGKTFHFLPNESCNCHECPYMKMNTLEKLRDALVKLEPRIELPAALIARARLPLERMLSVHT